MKKSKKQYNRSFAAKMTFILCMAVLVVFALIYSYTMYKAAASLLEKEKESAATKVSLYSNKIERIISTVEINVFSHEAAVKRNLNDTVVLSGILRGIMRDSTLRYAFVCLEPNYGNFGEYGTMYNVVRNESQSAVFRKRERTYRFNTYPYYTVPTQTKSDYWTNPFRATNGDVVVAFSHPLIDDNGTAFGVMGVDLGLKELTEDFTELNSKDDVKSSVFLLSKDGKYLVNEDKEKIANETYITDARKNHSDDMENIGRDMLAGNDGTQEMLYKGKRYLVSYADIPDLGWGIAVCKPYDVIYERMMIGLLRTVLMLLVTMVLVGFLIWHIVRRRTQPIRSYAKSAAMIAEGDFDTPLKKATSGDEIQQLGDSLDNMRVSLKAYMQELTATTAIRQSMAKELSIAHDIQMGMLPHNFPSPPEYKDVDLFAYLQPAKEVGGDLYGFTINDGKLYFIIGDVSGKGIPASLVMAITISMFHAVLQSAATPTDVVDHINNAIAPNNERNMFVTLIAGELDLANGHLRFCNAGHDPMLLLHSESLEEIEMASNLPVGLIENFPYQMNEADMKPGDKLLLYTDGVVEAENPDKQLYAIDRLVAAVEKNLQLSSQGIIEMITDDVRTYANGADQSDDITIMSIHYKPE